MRDVLAQYQAGNNDPSIVTEWPDWGKAWLYPGAWHWQTGELGTGLFKQPLCPATAEHPGYETIIAGRDSTPNVGGNGFTGQVLLDLRNITFPDPEVYGGVTLNSTTNQQKDLITSNIINGYRGPWIPPGTQLGFASGVSASQVDQPFGLRYSVPSTVTVVIYNGTVYNQTDFETNIPAGVTRVQGRTVAPPDYGNPPVNPNGPDFAADCVLNNTGAYIYDGAVTDDHGTTTLTPLSYGLTISPFQTSSGHTVTHPGTFRMRAFASVNGATWNDLQVQWENAAWATIKADGTPATTPDFGISASNNTLAVRLQQSKTSTCAYTVPGPLNPDGTPGPEITHSYPHLPVKPYAGAATIYLEAEDKQTGLRRGQYVFANLTAPSDDFYAYMPGLIAYTPIELDTGHAQSIAQPMVLATVGGTNLTASDVTFAYDWFSYTRTTNTIAPTSDPSDITAAVNYRNGGPILDLSVGTHAATSKAYYLRIQVTDKHTHKSHWVWYFLAVQPPISNSHGIDQYVYTLGYANFRITEIGSNYIKGAAISGLLKPGDMIAGLEARLVPWEE